MGDRLRASLCHLRPRAAAAETDPTPVLMEVTLGDTAAHWAAAGYAVHGASSCGAAGAVSLGNVTVLLTGSGGPGLQSLGFAGICAAAAAAIAQHLPAGVGCHICAAAPCAAAANPNSVQELAELVIYASDLEGFLRALAEGGVATEKGYRPRAMKGTPFANARYFLQPQLRALVVGPASAELSEGAVRDAAAAAPSSMRWMFGSRGEGGPGAAVEVAGLMVVAGEMGALMACIDTDADRPVAAPRKAQQEGREIITVRARPGGPTPTVAYLSTPGPGAPSTVW